MAQRVIQNEWGKAVRIGMVAKEMTYKDLARLTGYSADFLKLVASRGGRQCSQKVIEAISDATGASPYLCTYYNGKGA